MGQTYCSMTPAGFIDDPADISTFKFIDYLTTNASQSVIHKGHMYSLAETIAKNPNNMTGVALQIRSDINNLCSGYLDNLEVDVRPMPIQEDNVDTHDYTMLISVSFSGKNGRETLAHSLSVKDSKISNVARVSSS